MNLRQKQIHKGNMKATVGGTEDAPPALCPPNAHVPAYVKRTGWAGLNEIERMGCARPPEGECLFSEWEAI
ncbi:MAG: hypothetical protein HY865_24705 [Chloroflexi bacterium]|nr:hypothetical protein [Chloroflexota bacterium]